MIIRAGIAACLVCALRAAAAEPRDNAVTTQPFELAANGGEVGFEHRMHPHWSALGVFGLRGGALGDYTSTTYTVGAELRWWHRASMTGLYAAVHASVGHTSLGLSGMSADLGEAWGVEERADAGWRFTIANRVAITPSLGLGAHHDIDSSGRFAAYTRPVVGIGFELGFLF